jgi:hypothetical protein
MNEAGRRIEIFKPFGEACRRELKAMRAAV